MDLVFASYQFRCLDAHRNVRTETSPIQKQNRAHARRPPAIQSSSAPIWVELEVPQKNTIGDRRPEICVLPPRETSFRKRRRRRRRRYPSRFPDPPSPSLSGGGSLQAPLPPPLFPTPATSLLSIRAIHPPAAAPSLTCTAAVGSLWPAHLRPYPHGRPFSLLLQALIFVCQFH